MPKAGAVEVRAVEFDVHEVPLPRLLIALPGSAAIRIPVPIGQVAPLAMSCAVRVSGSAVSIAPTSARVAGSKY